MRNKTFFIVIDLFFIICAASCAAGALVYLYWLSENGLPIFGSIGAGAVACVVLAQNTVFFFAGSVALIYAATKKEEQPEPDGSMSFPYVTRLTTMKESGEIKYEYDLSNQKALVIGKGDHEDSGLEYAGAGGSLKHEYAVLNLEKNYWYIEAISETYGIGMRKEHDSVFRRLRTDKPCLLGKNDVIEIAGERIVVR